MITLRFDGLYRSLCPNNNPQEKTGLMCYGWVIFRDGRSVAHGHGAYARPEDASSNSAEYLALIEGLQALRVMGMERETIEVIGDARSVIDQMLGCAGVSSPQSRTLYHRARRIARHFQQLHWLWQPRRHNHVADELTRRALRQVHGDLASTRQALQVSLLPRQGLTALLDLCVFSGI
jgi:ribonuclease HI